MIQDLSVFYGAPEVRVGDRVVVYLEKEIVKIMQVGHGGWVDAMEKHLLKKGKVESIDPDGDVEVKYNDDKIYVFNPNVVAKILSKGNTVRITDDMDKAKILQIGHGGWTSKTANILGNTGIVNHVFRTYEVCVKVADRTWYLNPLLCTVINEGEDDDDVSSDSDSDDEMFFKMINRDDLHSSEEQIGIPKGIANTELLALHYSVNNENVKLTEEILNSGVDINQTDTDGDTALHVAVIRKNARLTKLLVEKGAHMDILNRNKLAPIHIAIRQGSLKCIKELKDSTINLKNGNGLTPVMIAIQGKEYKILNHLLTYNNIDLTEHDKNGSAAIHIATQMKDTKPLEILLEKKPDLVNQQTTDKNAPLHIAVLNDCFEVADFLIKKAKAKVDIRESTGKTPLMLASVQNNLSMVKLLIAVGADINAKDKKCDTSLHLAIYKQTSQSQFIHALYMSSKTISYNVIDVVICLVENGANLFSQNEERKTPLDMITDDELKTYLQEKAKSSSPEKSKCLLCLKKKVLVRFLPCRHMVLCSECDSDNISKKKCMTCEIEIRKRIQPQNEEKETSQKRKYDLKSLFERQDRVCINIQKNKDPSDPEYREEFKEILTKYGTVQYSDNDDKITVDFQGRQYDFYPELLLKVNLVGDEVQLLQDIELVKILQKDHGGWTDEMNQIIGKTGTVVMVERKKSTVEFDRKLFVLNPLACKLIKPPQQEQGEKLSDNCCIKCNQQKIEMINLQCGHHKLCSDCKYIGKCTKC